MDGSEDVGVNEGDRDGVWEGSDDVGMIGDTVGHRVALPVISSV